MGVARKLCKSFTKICKLVNYFMSSINHFMYACKYFPVRTLSFGFFVSTCKEL